MNSVSQRYLLTAVKAALDAGKAILGIYSKTNYHKELKDDATPVTEADHAANDKIIHHLEPLGLPVLSEEGKKVPYPERMNWRLFWLVDPLDGTKEFIRGNGEFTVNIALIHQGRPMLGILYAPLQDILYYSDTGSGAFRLEGLSGKLDGISSVGKMREASTALPLQRNYEGFRVVASRSHINRETKRFIKTVRSRHPDLQLVSRGSALKFCLVAEGSADIYPRFGPTWEWDTAAGQAIAEAAGCRVTLVDEKSELGYNKEELLNPGFIVWCPELT
jgi:3'(2'), 5'-bisphosphate nucleotidase